MSTFNSRPAEVLGGQQWVKIAPVEAFSSIGYGYDFTPASVAFNSGYSWQDVYNTLEKITFSEENITTPSGDAWHAEVNCFIPGKLDGIDRTFDYMTHQRWIVAVNDWDDRVTIVGTIANGCKLKFKYDSRSKVAELKGIVLSFVREDKYHTRGIARSVLF